MASGPNHSRYCFMFSPVISFLSLTCPIGLASGCSSSSINGNISCSHQFKYDDEVSLLPLLLGFLIPAIVKPRDDAQGFRSPSFATFTKRSLRDHALIDHSHGSVMDRELRHSLPSKPDDCAEQINKLKTITGVSPPKRKHLHQVHPGLAETSHSINMRIQIYINPHSAYLQEVAAAFDLCGSHDPCRYFHRLPVLFLRKNLTYLHHISSFS